MLSCLHVRARASLLWLSGARELASDAKLALNKAHGQTLRLQIEANMALKWHVTNAAKLSATKPASKESRGKTEPKAEDLQAHLGWWCRTELSWWGAVGMRCRWKAVRASCLFTETRSSLRHAAFQRGKGSETPPRPSSWHQEVTGTCPMAVSKRTTFLTTQCAYLFRYTG